MKRILPSIASSALILSVAGSANAASTVAVNFGASNFVPESSIGEGENTAALDAAVGFNTPVWNNVLVATGAGNASGTATVGDNIGNEFGVVFHSRNRWNAGSQGVTTSTSDASQQVFRFFLDDGDDGSSYATGDGYGVTIQLNGLSSYLTSVGASNYNLTVLLNIDSGTAGFRDVELREGNLSGAVTDLTLIDTYTVTSLGNGTAPFTSPVPEGAGTDTGGTRGYVTITGLTQDQLTIALLSGGDGFRGSVAGFAITPIPEPGVSLLGAFGGALLLRRRRH